MADLKQNVSYEITAEDKTQAATDSALANLLKAEKAAKDAQNRNQEEAKKTKDVFDSITAALSGNFEKLGQQLAALIAKMRGVQLSAMALGAVGLAVTGVVAAVGGLVKAFQNAKAEADELEKLEFDRTLNNIEEGAKAYADQMARARQEAEFTQKVLATEQELLERQVKANVEIARQRELATATDDASRAAINKKYDRLGSANAEYMAEERRQAEANAAWDEIARLEKELAAAENRRAQYQQLGKGAADELNEMQNKGFWSTLGKSVMKNLGFGGFDTEADMGEVSARIEKLNEQDMAEQKIIDDLKAKIRDQELKIEKLDAEGTIAEDEREATEQKWLNEDWQAHDEEVKQAEEKREERIAEVKARHEEDLHQTKLANIRKQEEAEKAAAAESAAAHARLAAAQSAVKQAWGWYRDKDSLKAQIEEEKANAAAEAQFEKDFDKLRFRRDWREATNLSLDQEAVRRVALAREEEEAAQKAVTSIDQKMSEVVEELRKMTEEA